MQQLSRTNRAKVFLQLLLVLALAASCQTAVWDESADATAETHSALTATLPAANFTVSIRTPKSVSAQDVALAADGTLEVLSGGKVVRPPAPLTSTITNMGNGGVTLSTGSTVGEIWSKSTVRLNGTARAEGNVYASNVVVASTAAVEGSIVRNAELEPPTITTWSVAFPKATAQDLRVRRNTTIARDPGRLRTVTIDSGGTLALKAGTYYFDCLTFSSGGQITLDQSNGPVFVYIRQTISWSGAVTSAAGDFPEILVGYFGTAAVTLGTAFKGTFVAPGVKVALSGTSAHVGAFFARNISVASNATVQYRPATPIIVCQPPPLEECTRLIRWRDDLTGTAREIAYQADINRFCSMPGTPKCITNLVGRANFDYASAAQRVIAQTFTPAQYLAVSRDRTRKLRAAEDNVTQANKICTTPDGDGDWIPDPDDRCPGTPDLTPTDENGCPITIYPPGPDPTDVKTILDRMGMIFNPACLHAPMPVGAAGAALYIAVDPYRLYVFANRVTNQPAACPIWYQFQIEDIQFDLQSGEHIPGEIFDVAFMDREAIPTLLNLPNLPVPDWAIQFQAASTDPGTRGRLGSRTLGHGIRFRVRGVNANGVRGPWSDWHLPTRADCPALGINCG